MRPSGGTGRPRDDGPVGLLHRARAERRGELRRGARRARQQQHARGVAVQPMHQPRPIRRAEAQRIEQAVEMTGDARPALHRHPVRLVQHQHMVVAVDHQALQVARGVRIDLRPRPLPRAAQAAAECAPTGRRRAASPPRRDAHPRAPARCGTASGSRLASARENAGGTSDPAGCPLRPRRRRAPLLPLPSREGGGGRGPHASHGPLKHRRPATTFTERRTATVRTEQAPPPASPERTDSR